MIRTDRQLRADTSRRRSNVPVFLAPRRPPVTGVGGCGCGCRGVAATRVFFASVSLMHADEGLQLRGVELHAITSSYLDLKKQADK